MTYALVTAEPMPEQSRLPDSATTLADPGVWVTGLQFQSVEVQQSTGWYQVVTTARPADTATHTYVRTLTLVGGVPTETWTQRPWTAEELAARAAEANRTQLTDVAALNGRLTRLAAYKTDPEIVAALARANATVISTQDLNRLIKVMLRRDERQTATIALLVRLLDPTLLANVTDTADS